MNIHTLSFGDIMSTEILYYDEYKKEKCLDICRRWNITYLPDINQQDYHIREEDQFISLGKIPDERIFHLDDYIFDPRVIEVFKYGEREVRSGTYKGEHDVAFVFDKERLAGIVHICDYNKTQVMVELFKDVSRFEEQLRELLFIELGRDMSKVVEEIDRYNLNPYDREQIPKLSAFQGIGLPRLMKHSIQKNLNVIESYQKEPIRLLRNQVMHSSDRIQGETHEEIRSYDLESLEEFLKRIETLEAAYLKLQNRINLETWSF